MTIPRTAPPLPQPIIFDQVWANIAFLHWAVDPQLVQPYLPPGTRPDTWTDGTTYVGLVPFEMRSAGPGTRLQVPYFGRFLETNIRLYSVDEQGRHGVVFRSLDASRLAVVLGARWGIRIPYQWSTIRASSYESTHSYHTRRRWPRPAASSDLVIKVGGHVTATPLEEFLTRRWGMHSRLGGRTMWTPNTHPAWSLRSADVLELADTLGSAAGFPLSGRPDLRTLWSPGVRTKFGRPSLI